MDGPSYLFQPFPRDSPAIRDEAESGDEQRLECPFLPNHWDPWNQGMLGELRLLKQKDSCQNKKWPEGKRESVQ
jgi:hypothetical protein